MKAATLRSYGPASNLQIKEVNTPLPKANEVRVKIHCSTLTAGDCELRALDLPSMFAIPLRAVFYVKNRDIILGQEYAGVIDAIGEKVTKFKLGDRVFGPADASFACHAEHKCLKESHLISKIPEGMLFSDAATISTGGLNAIHFLDQAKLKSGQKLLIVGAGGSIGTFAVQIAKARGAHVTAVDEASKLDMLLSIGADEVINYKLENVSARLAEFDVIIDIANKTVPKQAMLPLKTNGLYIMTNISLKIAWQKLSLKKQDGKHMIVALAPYKPKEMEALMDYVRQGVLKPVIDRSYKLEDMIEAHNFVDSGKKAGHVVIEMGT